MTVKQPISSVKNRSHLDEVLQLEQDRTLSNRNTTGAAEARRRLKILHAICDEHYKTGSRDFSFSVLGPTFISQGGFKGMRTFREPYRTLVDAWSEFSDGHTRARKMIRADEETGNTVDYIDHHFSAFGQLPSWEALCNDGITAYRRESMSGSGKSMFINRCMELWRHNWLLKISPIIETACEQHWNLTGTIPKHSDLHNVLRKADLSIEQMQLQAAIEHWRQCYFAFAVWKFAPSGPTNGFQWLSLHPVLAEWKPIVETYLAASVARTLQKTARLALKAFFNDYLLPAGLPLSPHILLSRNQVSLPCFAELCLKGLSSIEIERRWRAVDRMIEYALDYGDQFTVVDTLGHRVRATSYHNPLPSLKGQSFDLVQVPRKRRLPPGALIDPELLFMTEWNPLLEQWRTYAVGWLASRKGNLGMARTVVRQLIVDYIMNMRLPLDPSVLLSIQWQRENELPSYVDNALSNEGISKSAHSDFSMAVVFLDYVLLTHFSAEDDYGRRVVSGDYHNFLLEQNEPGKWGHRKTHSNKEVLPSRYIRYLRDILCPDGSRYFGDFHWSHTALPSADWFAVSKDLIDKNDPDCVWRTRVLTGKKGAKATDSHKTIYEIWSPVRTVALMIKLELPLRTFQVRMLDSGEADSWRYDGSTLETDARGEPLYRAGSFSKNIGPLVSNVGKSEREAGLFRRLPDVASGKIFAGLYINTNKTQDRGKDQWDRGYVVPWQHGKVLYWCERLRNWQEKYNPIRVLTLCSDLSHNIIGPKTESQKQQMGRMAFLFRDPLSRARNAMWPITDDRIGVLWRKTLEKLEHICAEKGHVGVDGVRIRFFPEVGENEPGYNTFYPLHSLRVSLITHLATEGGVEMHILSECIVGHSRILMTLYYKKSGVVYVSEAMDAATDRLKDEVVEQDNWVRWVKEATLKQLAVNAATVDASVLQAVQDAFNEGGASLIRTNLGLCAKGGMGCNNGGIQLNEDNGALTYGPVPGYPQQKNCIRCRWFLTGPAFLLALVHHFNLLHFNLGESGARYLKLGTDVSELEAALLKCQSQAVKFEDQARLDRLRHEMAAVYDGNEKLASDSLATMKLIVRCKHIVDEGRKADTGVVLVAVGCMDEVTINLGECTELEQILTVALGSTVYVDEDAKKAVLRAGNAFDRMLALNGKDPIFFRLSEEELPAIVGHMTNLLQAYAGSIGRAVPFVEGAERLSELGILGDSMEILKLASAGTPVQLGGRDQSGPILISRARKIIPLRSANTSMLKEYPNAE
jgi:hypothetical protein